MEEEPKSKSFVVWGLGALGLGVVATAVAVPHIGLWLALGIILIAAIIFGLYLLFRRLKARRQSRNFEGAVSSQTASSRSISDPNRRAALDKLRQKFQTGLQEFKSRGKDIYKLPWYVIIGEPGSGKSEAIRHSGVERPPGLQDELQGSGGTMNMDWWFTNRSVILDTAGSMIFNEMQTEENPEWREFLRLLKKARSDCPINGLFLVLSVESLIKDSADKISQKASRLAQQLDLIQRTLDVRFPVYLLVTKCDLLTGFREFFDNIEDPLLQHQMFGWSNPTDLDTAFQPELVEQHLKTVSERLRRRRLALLREGSAGSKFSETQFFVSSLKPGTLTKRRLDEVDSLFALPESVMRLAPRLRRYLETIFVAGEWSAKPVFLRGIYFTSSMREGQALDEATALALGLPVEQLPEDRSWEKNRSFFMRDLFVEKVFRESGLVTRATNTLKLVRQRRLLIFGTALVAMVLLLTFSLLSYRSLNRSVLTELSYWQAGSTNWVSNDLPYPMWEPLVRAGATDPFAFTYVGGDPVPGVSGLSLVQYQKKTEDIARSPFKVGLVFKPMTWLTGSWNANRRKAQELLFDGSVVRPLVYYTRQKMQKSADGLSDPAAVARHREALLALIRLESDALSGGGGMKQPGSVEASEKYLNAFLSYLCNTNLAADTNLVGVLSWTYGKDLGNNAWPPALVTGENSLEKSPAIRQGLEDFRSANQSAQREILDEVHLLNDFADHLGKYQKAETTWLNTQGKCEQIAPGSDLDIAFKQLIANAATLNLLTNFTQAPLTNLADRYQVLQEAAKANSSAAFRDIASGLPDASRTTGLFFEIDQKIKSFASAAAAGVLQGYSVRSNLVATADRDQLILAGKQPAYVSRWNLYQRACSLAASAHPLSEAEFGSLGDRLAQFQKSVESFTNDLAKYSGPMSDSTKTVCGQIAGDAVGQGKEKMLEEYATTASGVVVRLMKFPQWTGGNFEDSSNLLTKIGRDLNAVVSPEDSILLRPVGQSLLAVSANLARSTGFPVVLDGDASKPMSISDMNALQNLSGVLLTALNDPGWNAVFDQPAHDKVLKSFRQLNDVINALINPDGSRPFAGFSFLPPRSGADDIIRVFRQANISMGQNQSGWVELDRYAGQADHACFESGTRLSTSDGLQIDFRRLSSDPSPQRLIDLPDWALIRLIHGGKAQSKDGIHWQFGVNLKDDASGISGVVQFEIQTTKPLPKVSDWPQNNK